jgi:hypothetical protein
LQGYKGLGTFAQRLRGMALFDPPKAGDRPKHWKDFSLEFKLMFVYHGCMMVLFLTGSAFSARQELIFAGLLLSVLISLSVRHRVSAGWRWQGVKTKQLFVAAGGIALIGLFLYSGTAWFSPSNPRFLPWFLAGFGIGAFNVMQTLGLVYPSEAAFLADCREPGSQIKEATNTESIQPSEPGWHKAVRSAYSVLFFIVWLEFMVFFYYSGTTFRDGSPVPTPSQMEPVTDHGKTVYITHDQKSLRDKLELFGFIGIPSAILGGFLLHFVVGVKLHPDTPTLREFLARKSSGN